MLDVGFGDVDGAGRVALEQRVVKCDDVGLAGGEDRLQVGHEAFLRWVVGPEGEYSAGVEGVGEALESFLLMEHRVAFVEEIGRGVVDVEEDGVEPAARLVRVEARFAGIGQGALLVTPLQLANWQ